MRLRPRSLLNCLTLRFEVEVRPGHAYRLALSHDALVIHPGLQGSLRSDRWFHAEEITNVRASLGIAKGPTGIHRED